MDKMFLSRKIKGKVAGGGIGFPLLPISPKAGATIINPFILPGSTSITPIYFGNKKYELADWLGNVRVVITDKKYAVNNGNTTISYMPIIASITDYYSFGSEIFERTYSHHVYRFGFNGKEDLHEQRWYQDYGARFYNKVLGRFVSADPLIIHQKKYSWLTPYQFASLNPIKNIDVDGLEGVQYLETTIKKDGSTVVKRIVELDVFVATSKKENSIHYKSSDLSIIQSNLQSEYNKGFKDFSGNDVEFRFNVKEFDVDNLSPRDKERQLRIDPTNLEKTKDGRFALRGFVLQRGILGDKEQGKTEGSVSIINNKAKHPFHTIAHEVGHIFLNYDMSKNPDNEAEHEEAGGIFKYERIDKSGNIIVPVDNVNQKNVNEILKVLPEVESKRKEEK